MLFNIKYTIDEQIQLYDTIINVFKDYQIGKAALNSFHLTKHWPIRPLFPLSMESITSKQRF